LADYTPLTQKSTERGTREGQEYTTVIFNEAFQAKDVLRNSLAIYDNAEQELKDWVIKQPKV